MARKTTIYFAPSVATRLAACDKLLALDEQYLAACRGMFAVDAFVAAMDGRGREAFPALFEKREAARLEWNGIS